MATHKSIESDFFSEEKTPKAINTQENQVHLVYIPLIFNILSPEQSSYSSFC